MAMEVGSWEDVPFQVVTGAPAEDPDCVLQISIVKQRKVMKWTVGKAMD